MDEAYFEEYMKKWLADDQSPADPDYVAGRQNRDVWSNYIFAEDVGGVLVLRFIIVEATLSALLTLDPQDGMALYNVWTEWLDSWTSRSQRFEYNFQTNLHYAFVSDSRANLSEKVLGQSLSSHHSLKACQKHFTGRATLEPVGNTFRSTAECPSVPDCMSSQKSRNHFCTYGDWYVSMIVSSHSMVP